MHTLFSFDVLNRRSNRFPSDCTGNVFDLSSSSSSSSSSLSPPSRTIKVSFGENVVWHPRSNGGHHLSPDELDPFRLIGDPSLDAIFHLLDSEGTPVASTTDILALAQHASSLPSDPLSSSSVSQTHLVSFLRRYRTLPPWANPSQIQRGQNVFLAYAPAISLSLYYRSLVAGFSIPKIAAVVRSTGYLAPPSRPDQVLQRLLDTGQLIAACVAFGMKGMEAGGEGWTTALHVRVLHAKVRRGLMLRKRRGGASGEREGERGGGWDVERWGVPINQEDMAATLLAFATNSVIGVEFVAGLQMERKDEKDYLALWRYIGWLLGVEVDEDSERDGDGDGDIGDIHKNGTVGQTNEHLNPTSLKTNGNVQSVLPPLDPCGPGSVSSLSSQARDTVFHSRSIFQSILLHILEPDETSIQIAHHLLRIGRQPPSDRDRHRNHGRSPPPHLDDKWFYFRALQCRRFIGDPLADALHLPFHPHLFTRIALRCASTFYLLLVRVYTLGIMFVPPFRRYMVYRTRIALQRMYQGWRKTHVVKLKKALETGGLVGLDDGDGDRGMDSGVKKKAVNGGEECCPFAMVAPPTRDLLVSSRQNDDRKPMVTKVTAAKRSEDLIQGGRIESDGDTLSCSRSSAVHRVVGAIYKTISRKITTIYPVAVEKPSSCGEGVLWTMVSPEVVIGTSVLTIAAYWCRYVFVEDR